MKVPVGLEYLLTTLNELRLSWITYVRLGQASFIKASTAMYLIHFPTLKPLNLPDNKIFNVVGKFSVSFSCTTVPAEEIKQNTFFVTQKKLN